MKGILRPFYPKSWFHPVGILKILKDLMPRLPDVSGSLFLTLTVDPAQFSGPESAFEYSRDRVRRIFARLREGVQHDGKTYRMNDPYFVKVEFHQNGFAHFHLIFLTKRYLPRSLLSELWGCGIVDVRRIKNERFHYLLKYVTKGGELPEWVKERPRIRIIQASRGFYVDKREQQPRRKPFRKLRRESLTIGERLKKWANQALFETPLGTVRVLALKEPYEAIVARCAYHFACLGQYFGNGRIQITNSNQIIEWITKSPNLAASMCSAS